MLFYGMRRVLAGTKKGGAAFGPPLPRRAAPAFDAAALPAGTQPTRTIASSHYPCSPFGAAVAGAR